MGIVTMEPQGKQIPCSSSVGVLAVIGSQNAKLRGWVRKFRLPVAWNSSAIMHAAGSLSPPTTRGTRVQAADRGLAAEPRSTSGPCCVDFSKKYRWAGNALKKKKLSIIQKTQKKDRTLGNFDFPFWGSFFLAASALNLNTDFKKHHENEQRCSCRANGWKAAEGPNRATLGRFSSEDIM